MTVIKKIKPNDGLNEEQREAMIGLLKTTLADQHVLYMKLRHYHWNITGPQFIALHELFEEQYDDIADKIDDTAERIRQYGDFAPGTLKAMIDLTRLTEDDTVPSAREMVANLVADHESVIRALREDIEVADDHDDVAVEDYLTGLLQDHQKMAWLLRAHLEGEAF
jgi:starvation-inducible DNA-binding protein